jgi:hypothetical protein
VPARPELISNKLDELAVLARSDLLKNQEVNCVRNALRDTQPLVARRTLVPCHHDYNLRNWLTCDDRVNVIDFEWPNRCLGERPDSPVCRAVAGTSGAAGRFSRRLRTRAGRRRDGDITRRRGVHNGIHPCLG